MDEQMNKWTKEGMKKPTKLLGEADINELTRSKGKPGE